MLFLHSAQLVLGFGSILTILDLNEVDVTFKSAQIFLVMVAAGDAAEDLQVFVAFLFLRIWERPVQHPDNWS